MVAAFPFAKLGVLFLKQISKPIANAAKERAKSHPFFRKYLCMPPAQIYNWCEIKARMYFLNLGKPVNIPRLNEAQAIELGANILGEAIVFGIAVGVFVLEMTRQLAKTRAKERDDEERLNNLKSTIQELCIQAERTDAQIRQLERYISELDSIVVKKPWTQIQNTSAQDQNNSSKVNKEKNGILEAINYIENDILILNNSKDKKITQPV